MKEHEIEYLLKIEEEKSISKAADALFISQPALSKYLKTVEAEYGGKLFERIHGQTVPTPLGKIYLKYARQEKNLILERDAEMHALSIRQKHHILHFGIPSSRIMDFLPFLEDLKNKNPETVFRITTDSSERIQQMLDNDELDLALCNSNEGHLLAQEYLTVLIPEPIESRLHIQMGESISLSLLKQERFILSSENNLAGRLAVQAFDQAGFHPTDVLYFDNTLLTWDIASQGQGIAFSTNYYKNQAHAHMIEPRILNEVRLICRSKSAKKLHIPSKA